MIPPFFVLFRTDIGIAQRGFQYGKDKPVVAVLIVIAIVQAHLPFTRHTRCIGVAAGPRRQSQINEGPTGLDMFDMAGRANTSQHAEQILFSLFRYPLRQGMKNVGIYRLRRAAPKESAKPTK